MRHFQTFQKVENGMHIGRSQQFLIKDLLATFLPLVFYLLAIRLPLACHSIATCNWHFLATCLPLACHLFAIGLPLACHLLATSLPLAWHLLDICLPLVYHSLATCLPLACWHALCFQPFEKAEKNDAPLVWFCSFYFLTTSTDLCV